jgi:hypothetical protein
VVIDQFDVKHINSFERKMMRQLDRTVTDRMMMRYTNIMPRLG